MATLERLRGALEEIEEIDRLIVGELDGSTAKTQREQVVSDHKLAVFLNAAKERAQTCLGIYKDEDGTKKQVRVCSVLLLICGCCSVVCGVADMSCTRAPAGVDAWIRVVSFCSLLTLPHSVRSLLDAWQEVDLMSGPNALTNFYEQLRETKTYHRRFHTAVAAASAAQPAASLKDQLAGGAEVETKFTDEESVGRYVRA